MSKVILLDPGHGFNKKNKKFSRPLIHLESDGTVTEVPDSMTGHPREGQHGYYREDFGTVEIATAAYAALEKMGYEVYMTRSPETDLNAKYVLEDVFGEKKSNWLSWRWVKEASVRWNADALVSIHTNASKGTGCSAFYAHPRGMELGEKICNEIHNEFGLRVRRVSKRRFLILRNTGKNNSCLVECAFHDNPKDLALLLDDKAIARFGEAIARGIDKHFNPGQLN